MKNLFCFCVSTGIFCFLGSGCSPLTDVPRKIWGSSTTALEKARARAESRVFVGTPEDCFDAVAVMTVSDLQAQPPRAKILDMFLRDSRGGRMIVMGVPGAIDTTEVGIFFIPLDNGRTRVELSSLSTHAKLTASALVFAELERHFPVYLTEPRKMDAIPTARDIAVEP